LLQDPSADVRDAIVTKVGKFFGKTLPARYLSIFALLAGEPDKSLAHKVCCCVPVP
jgi:hypothetical protein